MSFRESSGNGNSHIPVEIYEGPFPPPADLRPAASPRRRLWTPLVLFLLTVVSTLAVGAEFARSYAQNREPFSDNPDLVPMLLQPFTHPRILALGIPFSFTLLGILLAHELGHFFTCKYYGIDATYPYFIPAPTLFGTFGAFIRIRSPIPTRRALFDVGFSGPLVGFVIAVPAMAYAVAVSKIVPGAAHDGVLFGTPPLVRLFIAWFHPGAAPASLLLDPVGRAAWVGLFATALNLLPVSQLDGGHILYSVASRFHQRISLAASLALVALGLYCWQGWILWGVILTVLSLRYRHPPLLDRWQPLGVSRRLWALAALVIFLLCFTPWPATSP